MSNEKQVTQGKTKDVSQQSHAEAMLPLVDIYEDDSGITLTADLPGVSDDRLNLQIDKDTLLIEGDMAIELPTDLRPLHAEIRTTRFRRSFALSSELDSDAVQAKLKNGVLRVVLPKRKELQPRKIKVRTN